MAKTMSKNRIKCFVIIVESTQRDGRIHRKAMDGKYYLSAIAAERACRELEQRVKPNINVFFTETKIELIGD